MQKHETEGILAYSFQYKPSEVEYEGSVVRVGIFGHTRKTFQIMESNIKVSESVLRYCTAIWGWRFEKWWKTDKEVATEMQNFATSRNVTRIAADFAAVEIPGVNVEFHYDFPDDDQSLHF